MADLTAVQLSTMVSTPTTGDWLLIWNGAAGTTNKLAHNIYSLSTHNHSGVYAPISHSHNNSDISASGITDGYVLTAQSNNAVWAASAGGGGGAAQLTDLSDVSSATVTSGNVLVGNGSTFASRALTKSDVGLSNVTNVSEASTLATAATLVNAEIDASNNLVFPYKYALVPTYNVDGTVNTISTTDGVTNWTMTFAYVNGDVSTITVYDGTTTWVDTFTYSGGSITNSTGWV